VAFTLALLFVTHYFKISLILIGITTVPAFLIYLYMGGLASISGFVYRFSIWVIRLWPARPCTADVPAGSVSNGHFYYLHRLLFKYLHSRKHRRPVPAVHDSGDSAFAVHEESTGLSASYSGNPRHIRPSRAYRQEQEGSKSQSLHRLQRILAIPSRILPLVAVGMTVAAILSFAVPSSGFKTGKIGNVTDDVFSFLHIPLPDTANRDVFNLGSQGFYPLQNRLGGPVTQNTAEVMKITASSDFLLRATTYNNYEHTYWSSTNSIFSNRLHSGFLGSDTEDFFDMERPDSEAIPAELYQAIMEPETILISDSSSVLKQTLFSADHLLDLVYPDRTVFYNQASELFVNDPIKKGDTYSVTFNRFRTESPTFDEDLLSLESYILLHPDAGDSDKKLLQIDEENLMITESDSVKTMALLLTKDATTPLEKVFAIRDALLSRYTYSLNVEAPPENFDFVEYFLYTKTGYCTYFASTMAVLARLNGVPARYVEGFMVNVPNSPDGDKTVSVTGKSAHAWCEVYINGIGWIPIDATAGPAGSGHSLSEEASENSSSETSDNETKPYTPPDQGYLPSNLNPTPYEKHQLSEAEKERLRNLKILSTVITIGIPLLALGLFTALSIRKWRKMFRIKPADQMIGNLTHADLLNELWRKVQNHMSLLSVNIEVSETAGDFAERILEIPVYTPGCRKDTYNFNIQPLTKLYDQWMYGLKRPTDEESGLAYSCCRKLADDVKAIHKTKLAYLFHILKRMWFPHAKRMDFPRLKSRIKGK
jgi:transglutaminase-like putative cysteine protease